MTALGVGRGVALVPLGWAADRFSKRATLLGSLALSGAAYASFTVVESSTGFILARTLQGLGVAQQPDGQRWDLVSPTSWLRRARSALVTTRWARRCVLLRTGSLSVSAGHSP